MGERRCRVLQTQVQMHLEKESYKKRPLKKACSWEVSFAQKLTGTSLTLVWLHVHVWSGTIVAHWLSLAHSHLILHWHTLRGWHWVIIATHWPMATWRHVHGTVRHIELVRSRSLHRHMVRSFRTRQGKKFYIKDHKPSKYSHTESQNLIN